jgi:phytoene desaturase
MKSIAIIGGGFSSLSASCYLANAGYDVTIYEKNSTVGGRARQLFKEGFTFDIGPTFYWMPDIFDKFFNEFGKSTSDYYELERLDPAYWVYFGINDFIEIGGSLEKIYEAFEKEVAGSSLKLKAFIKEAEDNYNIAIGDLVYKMYGESPLELVSIKTAKKLSSFLSNIKRQVRKEFKNNKLAQILEFPVLFLGAKPNDTPAFYNFMNFADFGLGTWHPKGGMYSVVKGIEELAKSLGVKFEVNSNVTEILVKNNETIGLVSNNTKITADIVVCGADYAHGETLLPKQYRSYSEEYWDNKKFAPSSLLFYIGIDKKLKNVAHHTLFFDVDFDTHAEAIYDNPKWPEEPLFYASFPSITDETSAPEGKEAAIILIPLAPGLEDTSELRDKYFNIIVNRIEKLTSQKIKDNILFKESYCVNDFIKDYNSYKGNAYGMANTLLQTAFMRPKIKSKKIRNLYFTGQLTVPGPGVPPSLISGKLVSDLVINNN